MTINESAKELNITKRAIKYYEEQGLLKVAKDSNGYRNYTKQDVETLRMISIYRKLGISISDIKKLLEKEDKEILLYIISCTIFSPFCREEWKLQSRKKRTR